MRPRDSRIAAREAAAMPFRGKTPPRRSRTRIWSAANLTGKRILPERQGPFDAVRGTGGGLRWVSSFHENLSNQAQTPKTASVD